MLEKRAWCVTKLLKNSRKHYVLFFVFGVFFVMNMPVAAYAGWFDFLNPMLNTMKRDPAPAETLIAPFANRDAVMEELDPSGKVELAVPLDQRHRPNVEIARFAQQIIPTVLTYHSDRYEKEYMENIKNFSKVGAQEFVKFLKDRSIVDVLRVGRYNITGIVRDYPIIVNEGVVEGRYRWLIQSRILITYLDNKVKKMSDAEADNMVTHEFILTMQLGRVSGVENPSGLMIETWDVKSFK